jgi:RecB family endonuclease NucS
MRLVIADCSVDYAGRLTAHLPKARRLLMLKGDGSILIHSETGSYKPLNWMNPPCNYSVHEPDEEQRTSCGFKSMKFIMRSTTN